MGSASEQSLAAEQTEGEEQELGLSTERQKLAGVAEMKEMMSQITEDHGKDEDFSVIFE